MENAERIWKSYSKTKDPKIKEQLIIQYSPLIKYVAGRLSVHIGKHVEFEDLLSAGIFGLIDAIDKFDFDKGVKFETYASLRIRGSIIDNIRKMDWVPRTLRQKNKALESTYTELENILGREPTDKELAEKLGLSVSEVQELIRKSSVSSLVSLDDYLEQNYEGTFITNNTQADTPESSYEKKEAKTLLLDAINKLSDREKTVVSLYYFDELTLREISQILGVSESRVSQIHSKAVLKLKTKLGKYKSMLFIN